MYNKNRKNVVGSDKLDPLTEQQWLQKYVEKHPNPLPVVIGTRGTWKVAGTYVIILVAFTEVDIELMASLHGVSHHPVRKMKLSDTLTYYAVNIIKKKQVREIIQSWN